MAAASLCVLALWIVLTVLSLAFQQRITDFYFRDNINEWELTLPFTIIGECAAALLIGAADLMIYRGKGRRAPLLTASVTMGVTPVVRYFLNYRQLYYYAISKGSYALARLNVIGKISEVLIYFLYAAAVIAIAAGAVYNCERNNAAPLIDTAPDGLSENIIMEKV